MRRIIFWTGTLVLGLAASIWATAPLRAQHGGDRGRGGPVRVGHPIARIGSIHYGARAGRDPAGPAATGRLAGAPTAIPTTRSIPGAFVPVIARSCLAVRNITCTTTCRSAAKQS